MSAPLSLLPLVTLSVAPSVVAVGDVSVAVGACPRCRCQFRALVLSALKSAGAANSWLLQSLLPSVLRCSRYRGGCDGCWRRVGAVVGAAVGAAVNLVLRALSVGAVGVAVGAVGVAAARA